MSEEDDDKKQELWRAMSPEYRMFELVQKLSARVDTNAEESRHKTEETQRNIDFIIQQQAQFAADIQSLRETQAHAEERWTRSEERWARTEEGIRSLLSIAEIHEREITALSETTRSLGESTLALGESTRATDERLNALIIMFEQYISERRNGK
ncbi:MAG: hypothetical protein LC754_08630 [Acidobacteria bacterium]|nr:hypothetical protein [Acidobacteriota bacterium]